MVVRQLKRAQWFALLPGTVFITRDHEWDWANICIVNGIRSVCLPPDKSRYQKKKLCPNYVESITTEANFLLAIHLDTSHGATKELLLFEHPCYDPAARITEILRPCSTSSKQTLLYSKRVKYSGRIWLMTWS